MHANKLKKISFVISAVAAVVTGVIGIDTMNLYSLTTLGFIVLAISPYGFLAILIKLAKSKVAIIVALIVSVLVCLFGLGTIIDAMYIHFDAQGGLVYIFIPLWQWIGLLVVALPILLLNWVKDA